MLTKTVEHLEAELDALNRDCERRIAYLHREIHAESTLRALVNGASRLRAQSEAALRSLFFDD